MKKPKTKHPLYGTWYQIKRRCNTPWAPNFSDYGGRGISICKEWNDSLEDFAEYVGPKPAEGMTIDRIDNDGNYESGNVKWSTQSEQQRNRRPFKQNSHISAHLRA